MGRYEMVRGVLESHGGYYLPLRVTLPLRAHGPQGLCLAVVGGDMRAGRWLSPLPLLSVSIGDGQPLFEGVPAVAPPSRRIRVGDAFIPLVGDELNGADLRVVPICPALMGDSLAPLGLDLILRYDDEE